MSVEEVRRKAERFLRRHQRELIARSAFSVIAAVFCGIAFMKARVSPTGVIAGLVMAMLLTGTFKNLYAAFVRSRGIASAVPSSSNTALTSCLEFYRSELEAQRLIARQPAWQLGAALLIIGWLTRYAAAAAGKAVFDLDDLDCAIATVDRATGRAPELGRSSAKLRVQYLMRDNGLENLLSAYGM